MKCCLPSGLSCLDRVDSRFSREETPRYWRWPADVLRCHSTLGAADRAGAVSPCPGEVTCGSCTYAHQMARPGSPSISSSLRHLGARSSGSAEWGTGVPWPSSLTPNITLGGTLEVSHFWVPGASSRAGLHSQGTSWVLLSQATPGLPTFLALEEVSGSVCCQLVAPSGLGLVPRASTVTACTWMVRAGVQTTTRTMFHWMLHSIRALWIPGRNWRICHGRNM